MKTEPAKHILQSVRGGDQFYLRAYNANLYRGCDHGCVYCDSRSVCYQIADFDTVRVKQEALTILRSELINKRSPGVVGFGATSDSYNSYERTEFITHGALKLLAQFGFGVGITTKSSLVARDADVLQKILRFAPAHVTFSITCADDRLSKILEPGAPASSERFLAMRFLSDAGILCGTWINPVLPFLTDSWENIRALLDKTKCSGGRYAMCHFGMTLREGNREYYYAALDRDFPGVKERYAKTFALSYECPSPSYKELEPLFNTECERLGLAYTFSSINALVRASGGATQMRLI